METKTALVLGAGGFIGSHLVKRLKQEGYWVRGVDRKYCEFNETEADDFVIGDLRDPIICKNVMGVSGGFDELYQLAAEMGGMGYIEKGECDIMHNSALININSIHAAALMGIKRYFFSSSVCIYRNMKYGENAIFERDAYPAEPDNEYGWEKLYAERIIQAYARKYGIEIRIARFQNCYGPEGTWYGIRVKAPAAISRKVAAAHDGDAIEVWGDGKAVRGYTYIDDIVAGILILMRSEINTPTNIGTSEHVTVDELVQTTIDISRKKLLIRHIKGPVGVEARNFDTTKIRSLGWTAHFSLKQGISLTYPWVLKQVNKKRHKKE